MTHAEILAEIKHYSSSITITRYVLHVHLSATAAILQTANLSHQKSVEENQKFRLNRKIVIQNSRRPRRKKKKVVIKSM